MSEVGGEQPHLAAVQLRPAELTAHVPLRIEAEPPGEPRDADGAADAGVAQCLRQPKRIEAEGKQPPAMRTAGGPCLARGRAHGVGEIAAE